MCAQHKQATKAAQLRFYETLRSELGSEVGVTILTAGFVESEMTKGKVIQKDGQVAIDLEARDVSCKKKKKKKKKNYVSQGHAYIYTSFACRCRSGCSQWPVWRSCAR
jgi:short-subunit dehydrogenase